MHFQAGLLLSCDQADDVLLPWAAQRYLLNADCPKNDFPSHTFYIAARRCVNVPRDFLCVFVTPTQNGSPLAGSATSYILKIL